MHPQWSSSNAHNSSGYRGRLVCERRRTQQKRIVAARVSQNPISPQSCLLGLRRVVCGVFVVENYFTVPDAYASRVCLARGGFDHYTAR